MPKTIDLETLPLGLRMRLLRALTGMTQRDLAAHAGVVAPRISDFENGHRTPGPDVAARVELALTEAAAKGAQP